MISFILGISFTFEAAALMAAVPVIIKRAVFNGTSPGLMVYVGVFSIIFFILGQLCFFFTRNKYGYDSIFEHPYLKMFEREKEKEPVLEAMIEGRDIAEINRGEIIFSNVEKKEEETESDKTE